MSSVLHFDCFELDLASGQLRKHGVRIRLREQPLQVLASLLEHPGQVVTREDLRRRLWGDDVFVDFDNSLNIAIARLRTALGDSVEHPHYIETLPKRGYRFIGEVSRTPEPAAEVVSVRKSRLMVLPFVNLSGDPAQEYFSDAMTDELITALASLVPEHLAVIARTTAMHYKHSQKDVARIGRELGVDYVVEGAFHHSEQQVAVTVQLIQTRDRAHLFAKKYEATLRDWFHMQSTVARDIATQIDAPGVADEVYASLTRAPVKRRPTENLAAYNEYIQGKYLLERLTSEAMTGAKKHLEEAIRRDPEFALAHIALADFYTWLGYSGYIRPKDAYATGLTHAQRAVEIDGTLAEAHAVLAAYHKQLDYNWPAAEREMAKALELDPTSPFVRFCHALVILMPLNRMDEAVAELERALELDPLSALTRTWLGVMWLLARDYDRAIDGARALLELEPSSCWPPFIIGIAHRQKYFEARARGERHPDWAEEAIAGHLRAVELAPGLDHILGWLGLALGVCGREAEARAVLERLRQSERYVLPTSIAHIHFGLGEIDAAFEWFDRAVEERDQMMMPILSYGHFDPIRNDPRFAALLHKMKLG